MFCESCAISHHKEQETCAVCNKPTDGIFNDAKQLLERIKERQKEVEVDSKEQERKEIMEEYKQKKLKQQKKKYTSQTGWFVP